MKLGLYGSVLVAIALFFVEPYSMPAPELSLADRRSVLKASFALQALGRIDDAVDPIRIALQEAVHACDWDAAAVTASNLSRTLLTLCRLAGPEGAVAAATASFDYAELLNQYTRDSRASERAKAASNTRML